MSQSKIARREFLRNAAAVGAGALFPGMVLGNGRRRSANAFTLGFWDGTRFVPATQIQADPTLESVRLSFQGLGRGSVRFIQGVSLVHGSPAPYYAYVTPPDGLAKTQFSRTVDQGGLLFNVNQGTNDALTVLKLKLSTSNGSDPRLREGVYVLFDGKVNLATFAYDKAQAKSPVTHSNGVGAVPQCVVLTVARS